MFTAHIRKSGSAPSAVQQTEGTFFQPKLTINSPGDQYEQEADAMAERVVQAPRGQAPVSGADALGSVQREAEDRKEEPVQRKCSECEQEEKERVQRQEKEPEEEPLQRQPEQEEEKPVQTMPLMRKSASGGYTGTPALSAQLSASKGSGTTVPAPTRAQMESAFGADFSRVRIHTDNRAAEMNTGINARAFTHGADIYFNKGQYAPESGEGRKLLAHELTHVVQQGEGRQIINRKIQVPSGTTLNTYGYTHKKTGDVYSAPRVEKGSLWNETFTALLASPRTFKVAGTTSKEVDQNFIAHIKARLGIVSFAAKKKYTFGAGANFKMNPKYWDVTSSGAKVKPGVSQKDAINDLNINPKEYSIACHAATLLTMLGGSDSASLVNLPSSDTNDWVPGDWGYITNLKFSGKSSDVGLEGENIIYTGKNLFWGHFTGLNTYRALMDWFKEVKSWNGSAKIEKNRQMPSNGLL